MVVKENSDRKNIYISEPDKKVESLESKLGDSVDELEQHFSRNYLLLHGVRELEGENTNDVKMKIVEEEMEIDIWRDDVD